MSEIFIYIIDAIKWRLRMRYISLFLAVTLFAQDTDNPGDFKPVESIQIETQFIF